MAKGEQYKEVIDRLDRVLRSLNIPINPDDRFHQAARFFTEAQPQPRTTQEIADNYFISMHAGKDLRDISLILNYVHTQDSAIVKKKLKVLLGGDLNPKNESKETNEPRNVQYELRKFAQLRHAGVRAHLGVDHPDIYFTINGRDYGIEAKRIYSDTQRVVSRNFKDAAKQLTDHFLDAPHKRGIIALSVDRYLSTNAQLLEVFTQQTAEWQALNEAEAFRDKYFYLTRDRRILENPHVTAFHIDVSLAGWGNFLNRPLFVSAQFSQPISAHGIHSTVVYKQYEREVLPFSKNLVKKTHVHSAKEPAAAISGNDLPCKLKENFPDFEKAKVYATSLHKQSGRGYEVVKCLRCGGRHVHEINPPTTYNLDADMLKMWRERHPDN